MAKPTIIDYELMQKYFTKAALAIMDYQTQDKERQALTISFASKYMERMKEVLLFLEQERGVVNISSLLPDGFFLTRLFDCPHLSVQRSGAQYDGKYYIVDVIGENEEISTLTSVGEYGDIRHAFIILEKLSDFIYTQDQATRADLSTP